MKAHLTFHPSFTVHLIRNEQISKNHITEIQNFQDDEIKQLFWLTLIYLNNLQKGMIFKHKLLITSQLDEIRLLLFNAHDK